MFDNPDSRRNAIFIIVIGIVIFMAVIIVAYGGMGIVYVLKALLQYGIIGGIILMAFYAIYYIFFKAHRIDVSYINKKRIVDSARLTKLPYLQDLYVMGDKEHQSARIGRIVGWTRLENFKGEQEDAFVIHKWPFPLSMFSEPRVIRVGVEDHTPLVGDVYLKGLSLIKWGEFFWINQSQLDFQKIDETVKSEALRSQIFMTYADFKTIVDALLEISPEYRKRLEERRLIQLPTTTTSAPPQG
jgi:hypothetical protein